MPDEMKPAETKQTNPKDAVGVRKVPFSTISAPVMAEVGLAMLEGARKYGRHNYRVAGVRGSVYYDAVMRHLTDWWEGTDIDPESGIHHVSKAIAGLTVLRDSMIQHNWTDDRPPKSPAGWQAKLNAAAAAVIEKYPDAKPAHTALDASPAAAEAKPIPSPPPIPGPTAILECPTPSCVYVKGHGGECGQGMTGYKSDPRTGVEKFVLVHSNVKGAAEAAPFVYPPDVPEPSGF